jgi:hypothetical protein
METKDKSETLNPRKLINNNAQNRKKRRLPKDSEENEE